MIAVVCTALVLLGIWLIIHYNLDNPGAAVVLTFPFALACGFAWDAVKGNSAKSNKPPDDADSPPS